MAVGAARPKARMSLEELLLRHGAIDAGQLLRAREEQEKLGLDLGRALVSLGFVEEKLLVRAQAHALGLQAVDPSAQPLAPELVAALPGDLCEEYGIIAVGWDGAKNLLQIATSEPEDEAKLAAIAQRTGYRIEPMVGGAGAIAAAIQRHYFAGALRTPATPGGKAMVGVTLAPESGDLPPAEYTPLAEAVIDPEPGVAPELVAEGELAELRARVQQLEEMIAHPQFAALMARMERLEQIVNAETHALRAVGDLLVERKLISKEEWMVRFRRR